MQDRINNGDMPAPASPIVAPTPPGVLSEAEIAEMEIRGEERIRLDDWERLIASHRALSAKLESTVERH